MAAYQRSRLLNLELGGYCGLPGVQGPADLGAVLGPAGFAEASALAQGVAGQLSPVRGSECLSSAAGGWCLPSSTFPRSIGPLCEGFFSFR